MQIGNVDSPIRMNKVCMPLKFRMKKVTFKK